MANNPAIYELVQALSMQERRHFKLFAQRYSGNDSNYIRLFDALAAMPVYDESKLRRKLKGAPFVQHLAFEKHRLAALIRRALRLYHSARTVDIEIKEMLIDAEVLHEKSLYGHARRLLQNARKEARLYERFAFIPEITRLESRLFDLAGLEAVYEEESDALKKMQVLNGYRRLSNRVALLVAASHQVRRKSERDALMQILRHPLMRSEKKAGTFTAAVYFFYIQSVCREMTGDAQGACESRRRLVERMEADPAQQEIHCRNYLSALNNLGISQLDLQRYDELAETIEKIKAVCRLRAGKGEDIRVSSFVFSTILTLNLAIRTGAFEEACASLPKIEKDLARFGDRILPQFRVVLCNSIKYVYFGAGDLRKSLQWSNQVMQMAQADLRVDIQAMTRIFNLILHYELRDTDLLEYLLRSTYRYLLRSERLYQVETVVLHYLRHSSHLVSSREVVQSFGKLRRDLEPLTRDPFEQRAFAEFDIISWLDSKITRKSFAETMKKKHEKSLAAKGKTA